MDPDHRHTQKEEDDGSREPDPTPDERLRDHRFVHDGHLHLPRCFAAAGSGRAISPADSGALRPLRPGERTGKTDPMNPAGVGKMVSVTAAVITGAIALSGYAGVVGLLSGGISFGDTIDARLPFGSSFLAGLALLAVVAVPMTVASVAAGRGIRYGSDIVFGAGLALVAWIAVELAFIKAYSWFHPTYLVAAIVVLGLGWLMNRTASPAARPARLELQDTQLHA
jgi:hypothetical protein